MPCSDNGKKKGDKSANSFIGQKILSHLKALPTQACYFSTLIP